MVRVKVGEPRNLGCGRIRHSAANGEYLSKILEKVLKFYMTTPCQV